MGGLLLLLLGLVSAIGLGLLAWLGMFFVTPEDV